MECAATHMVAAHSTSRAFVVCGFRIGGTLAQTIVEALSSQLAVQPEDGSDGTPATQAAPCLISVTFGAPQSIMTGIEDLVRPESGSITHQKSALQRLVASQAQRRRTKTI